MKFLYMPDTHIDGSDIMNYRQQERYLKYVDELIDIFAKWIKQQGDIDFIFCHWGKTYFVYPNEDKTPYFIAKKDLLNAKLTFNI